jgi:4-hydroxy-tetrahydrodipicolinate synthase
VTAFAADGGLDLDALGESVRFQVAAGVDGVCALGGTGEPLSMTTDDSKRVIDRVVAEAGGRIEVVVGCLMANQADIIATGLHARAAGADAVMVLPPYFVMATPAHIAGHLAEIAAAVDLPVVLFNTPGRAGLNLDVNFILELIDAIPNLVAIKEASGDMVAVTELVRRAPPRFSVLQGLDELVLPTLAVGGRGAIVSGACLVPRLLRDLADAFYSGDMARARELQHLLMPLCEVIYAEPNPAPLKRALAIVGRGAGPTRPPLGPIQDRTEDGLHSALSDLRPWLDTATLE